MKSFPLILSLLERKSLKALINRCRGCRGRSDKRFDNQAIPAIIVSGMKVKVQKTNTTAKRPEGGKPCARWRLVC